MSSNDAEDKSPGSVLEVLERFAPTKQSKWDAWAQKLAEEDIDSPDDMLKMTDETIEGTTKFSVGLKDAIRRFRAKFRPPSSDPEIPVAEEVNTILVPIRAVIKGYTEALYPDFKVFGREMLANAIDALNPSRRSHMSVFMLHSMNWVPVSSSRFPQTQES